MWQHHKDPQNKNQRQERACEDNSTRRKAAMLTQTPPRQAWAGSCYLGVDSTVAASGALRTAREPGQNSRYSPEGLLTQTSQSANKGCGQASVTERGPQCGPQFTH